MKNKKGFTLIELLAVIVILAIIALIAVPIVLNMINSARKSAARSAALGYVDAIEYNNGFADVEQEGYTKITGEKEVSEIDVKMKGKKPDSGNVTISNEGKVTHAEMCINGYNVEYNGKDATVGDKCSGSNSSISNPVSFETDSWATINKAVKNNNTSVYNVGDEKTIEIDVNDDGVNETYHLVIVNNSTPDECSTEGFSQSACGFVLQFKELLNITNASDEKMNLTVTSVGGWPSCKMYTYLNETIYNKLPNDLKNYIKPTSVVSGHDSEETTNYTSIDKLYLLSSKEVGFNITYDTAKTETRKLDYYASGTGTDAKNKRIKYNYGTTTEKLWWLRSSNSNDIGAFCVVTPPGGPDACNAAATIGVAPAFRIGK